MDKIDLQHLELLLGKLQMEIGDQKFCLIPHYVHDSVYISTFKEGGDVDKQVIAINIEEALIKLKQ